MSNPHSTDSSHTTDSPRAAHSLGLRFPSPSEVSPSHTSHELPSSASSQPTPPTLQEIVSSLQSSPAWIGNSTRLVQNCEWLEDGTTGSSFLKAKDGVPTIPTDANGNVLVRWIGHVALSGSVLGADGGWKLHFRDLPRHKRVVRLIKPPTHLFSGFGPVWESQLSGAQSLVEFARRVRTGKDLGVTYSFFEDDAGALRARSALFQKGGDVWETDTLPELRYSTWAMDSNVRMAFDSTIAKGFAPRVLEAYDELGAPIHPNEVLTEFAGAIVSVTCTLERMLFKGQKYGGSGQFQIYANVVKVQILNRPIPSMFPLSQRKRRLEDDEELALGPQAKHHVLRI